MNEKMDSRQRSKNINRKAWAETVEKLRSFIDIAKQ